MGAHALALYQQFVGKKRRALISPLCCLDFRPEHVLLNPSSEPIKPLKATSHDRTDIRYHNAKRTGRVITVN